MLTTRLDMLTTERCRPVVLIALLALALAGCAETWTCPEGSGRMPLPGGGFADDCVPLSGDGGEMDGGGDDAGESADAGPCPACSGATPACDPTTGDCVQCTMDDDGACMGMTPLCDADANRCVECLGDADCGDPMRARCDDMGTCQPCDDGTQCVGVPGDPGVCDAGACVECTLTETAACGDNPCTTENVCSRFGVDRRTCESCDTDANCVDPAHFCVPMEYQMMGRPDGYCLEATSAGCEQPFGIATPPRQTLSGVGGMTFCGINEMIATCEAVRGLLDNAQCPGGADSECPQGGLCRTVGVLMNRCTYRCSGVAQCDQSPNPGSSCGQGMTTGVEYCGG